MFVKNIVTVFTISWTLAFAAFIEDPNINGCDVVKSAYKSLNGFTAADVPNVKIDGNYKVYFMKVYTTLYALSLLVTFIRFLQLKKKSSPPPSRSNKFL